MKSENVDDDEAEDETPIKEELSVFNQKSSGSSDSRSSSVMRLANETPCFNKPSARLAAAGGACSSMMLGGFLSHDDGGVASYSEQDRLEESADTATTSFQH